MNSQLPATLNPHRNNPTDNRALSFVLCALYFELCTVLDLWLKAQNTKHKVQSSLPRNLTIHASQTYDPAVPNPNKTSGRLGVVSTPIFSQSCRQLTKHFY
jgi:hypothetical protein